MQRTNWGRRPLSRAELEYAQLDTHYLIQLRSLLLDELTAKGRLTEARGAFERVTQSKWTARPFDPEGFWRIKGARDLDDTGLAVLRALYIYRDRRAASHGPPAVQGLGRPRAGRAEPGPASLALCAVADQGHPAPPADQGAEKALVCDRTGAARRSAPAEHDAPTTIAGTRRRRNATRALRQWRKQRAERRGVESDVVLSNRALHVLARCNPTTVQALEEL